jgi:hypothetical protein
MFRYPRFAIAFTSFCLLLVSLFAQDMTVSLTMIIFMVSPLLVIWMAVSILMDRLEKVPELKDEEQWGYLDRPDLKPVS